MLLKKGASTAAVVMPDGETMKNETRFYKGPTPTGHELAELIEKPIHAAYFHRDAVVNFEYRRVGKYKLHFARRVLKAHQ